MSDIRPILDKKGRERLERLKRRAEWLEKRIRNSPAHKELDYDRSELSALIWAIEVIEQIGVLESEDGL